MIPRVTATCLFFMFPLLLSAGGVKGKVMSEGKAVPYAVIQLKEVSKGTVCDSAGRFLIQDVSAGEYTLLMRCMGFLPWERKVIVNNEKLTEVTAEMIPDGKSLGEVVISGTLSEKSRSESPVQVEVYQPAFFRKNPVPGVFEAVGMINGVRPQLNCNVCNTGDIHMNGMEGPYTMILIDGMPVVSSLATVYGLMGIPNAIVERIEVVKGPASSLYGSEAMGGVINVITKDPSTAPRMSVDVMGTSWQEYNGDIAFSRRTGKNSSLLFNAGYYRYRDPQDKNGDGFTDVTLQERVSVFTRWKRNGKKNSFVSLAARGVYEDRWGGQMNWTRQFRGGDSIYGESIYTKRAELLGAWRLPLRENVSVNFSWVSHDQNSVYGTTKFNAIQHTAFLQSVYTRKWGRQEVLGGLTLRYNWYDDDTPATADAGPVNVTKPLITWLPGVFIQDEYTLSDQDVLLGGYRLDFHPVHGLIHSPRIAWKRTLGNRWVLRAGAGTGFRVVNIFTEDHAALTGAREVIILEDLRPERSVNGNVNILWRKYGEKRYGGIDATVFYSRFTNKINADYDTDPNKIIYDNLRGYAVSAGVSVNADITCANSLKLSAGASWMEVFQVEEDSAGMDIRTQQLHAPRWTGNFSVSYTFPFRLTADITGNVYGPMRLPVLPNDYRPEYSPWFTLLNLQLTYNSGRTWEWYGGVKNLLNFVPDDPIMRPFDPFDRSVNDPVSNPNGYTFDPSYNYAPLQGIRAFAGVRVRI